MCERDNGFISGDAIGVIDDSIIMTDLVAKPAPYKSPIWVQGPAGRPTYTGEFIIEGNPVTPKIEHAGSFL